MRFWSVAWLLLAPLAAQEPTDEIDRLLRVLREPGPEAAADRATAVDGLLLRREARAHTELARFVIDRFRAGEDSDGTAADVLEMFARHQAQGADPVFGDPETRSRVFQVWAPALAELAGASRFEGLAVGGAEVLRRAQPSDRVRFAEDVVGLPLDLEESRARAEDGMRALGRLRDLGMVRVLATRVEDQRLGEAARAALRELTFSQANFATESEVREWLLANKGRSYLDLAERAVRRVRQELSERAQAESQRVAERAARYVEALASGPQPDWSRLLDELRDDADPAVAEIVRGRLAVRMTERVRAGDPLGPPGPDRHEFGVLVRERFTRASGASRSDWLRLAAAAAVDPEKESFAATAELVRLAVEGDDDALALAALEVLPKFEGDDSRTAACHALTRAVASGQRALTEEALHCLLSPGWSAPVGSSELRQDWVDDVGMVLIGSNWPRELRELALDVVTLRDESRLLVGEFVPALGLVCQSTSEDPALRRVATARLPLFLEAADQQATVGKIVVDLLNDSDPAIRRVLAAQWGSVLRALNDTQPAIDAVESRVIAERDPRVLRALLDAVRAVDEPAELRVRLTKRLAASVVALGPQLDPALKPLFASSLQTLAIDPGRGLEEWQRSIDALIAIEDLDGLADVLPRRDLRQLARAGGSEDPASLDVVFLAARAFSPGLLPKPLAEVVADLGRRRTELGQPLVRPDLKLAAAEALLTLGRGQDALDQLGDLEAIEVDALRQEARWLTVRALLDAKDPSAGQALLQTLSGAVTDSRLSDAAYDAFLRAARRSESPRKAMDWLDRALAECDEGSARWLDTFLDRAERAIEAGEPTETVRGAMEAQRAAFESEEVPQAVRDRYRAVLERL